MLSGAKDFEEAIYFFVESLRGDERRSYAKYISIVDGEPIIVKEALEQLYETFKNFASTPEEIEVFTAQKEASVVLTKLRGVLQTHFPGITYPLPLNFYSDFFNITDGIIEAKPIQFDLLTRQYSKKTVEEINQYKQSERQVKEEANKKIMAIVEEKLPVLNALHRADISNSSILI